MVEFSHFLTQKINFFFTHSLFPNGNVLIDDNDSELMKFGIFFRGRIFLEVYYFRNRMPQLFACFLISQSSDLQRPDLELIYENPSYYIKYRNLSIIM